MDTTALSRTELLQVADAVAREKSIERDEVLEAMEQAIGKAGRAKYGHEHDIRAEIDRKTGEIRLRRMREVAEEIENEFTQLTLEDAQSRQPGIQVGEFIVEELPPIDLGRIAAQTAKQVIVQKVREAERARQFEEYKDRVSEIVNGIVKRNEFGNVTVDLGRAEGLMRRDESLPRESFRTGDRLRAYIYDVREESRGPQIFLSRSHPQFMAKLFAQEVPEIYDSIIEIKAVARDPESGVYSGASADDPASLCVLSDGSYGTPEGIICSFPCTTDGAGNYVAAVSLGVAAIKGDYEGKVSVTDVEVPRHYVIDGEGSGKPGYVKVNVDCRLTPTEAGAS